MLRIIEFKTEYRPGKDPVDWVLVAPLGADYDRTQTWHRVKKITPPENPTREQRESLSFQDMTARWTIIGPAYEAWKGGIDLPETGTPLEAWPGVTPDQARALKAVGIRTVEDVRDAGEAAFRDLRIPNARQLPKIAAEYLKGSETAAKDAKIAELEERMAAMAEMLEEKAAVEAPRRGRPRKETETA